MLKYISYVLQLKKVLPLKSSEYQRLFHRYLWFEKEMTVIRDLWAETESWMDKYK